MGDSVLHFGVLYPSMKLAVLYQGVNTFFGNASIQDCNVKSAILLQMPLKDFLLLLLV